MSASRQAILSCVTFVPATWPTAVVATQSSSPNTASRAISSGDVDRELRPDSGLAEIAAEYLRKGSQVYIEGKLRTRKWQDRDGNDRWTTEIVADEMQMLGGRGGGGSAPMPSDSGRSGGPPQSPPDEFEDDIPF